MHECLILGLSELLKEQKSIHISRGKTVHHMVTGPVLWLQACSHTSWKPVRGRLGLMGPWPIHGNTWKIFVEACRKHHGQLS